VPGAGERRQPARQHLLGLRGADVAQRYASAAVQALLGRVPYAAVREPVLPQVVPGKGPEGYCQNPEQILLAGVLKPDLR
jgi:hypothetical protein